ncbi:MAG: sterol desaturase family protein [Alphaproteobacteria bacterium]|nr:sterol desaturase family protein [Alphaproteobacteria bacterium]
MAETALQALLAWKSVLVGAWLAVFFLVERLFPAAPGLAGGPWSRASLRRVGRNAALSLVNLALSPLVVVPLTAVAASALPSWRPAWWSGGWGLAADLLMLDFLIYWWHRANHEIGLLWRFHRVHHLDATLDSTSALRFHFGEILLSALARAAAVVVLAIPLASVLAFEGLLLLATIFHHSNLRLPERIETALAQIVVTPSIHWVHHHKVRRDTDSNYSSVLSLWDRLFASRSRTRRRPDLPIGVEGEGEHALPALIARPFVP